MKPIAGLVGIASLVALGCSATGQDPSGAAGRGGAPSGIAGGGAGQGGGQNGGAGGAASACTYMGQTYAEGAKVPGGPPGASCGNCYCLDARVACESIDCNPDGGPLSCALDASYTVGAIGGLPGAYTDVTRLDPSNDFTFTRTWVTDGGTTSRSCSPSLPSCGDPSWIDVADVMTDLSDPDVQAAFAVSAPVLFGVDPRPGDGALFQVVRSTGGTIQVGYDCQSGNGSSCRPIPAGVARLAADLRALVQHQTTGAVCENVTRPFPL